MKDKMYSPAGARKRFARLDDGLGANSDIGAKLRALYGAVQDEGIPDKFLDLLERLDSAERQQVGTIREAKNGSTGE